VQLLGLNFEDYLVVAELKVQKTVQGDFGIQILWVSGVLEASWYIHCSQNFETGFETVPEEDFHLADSKFTLMLCFGLIGCFQRSIGKVFV